MTIRGALVKKGSDQTSADYSSPTMVSWGSAVYDYNGFFSGGAPTKLTCPAGAAGRYGVAYATIALENITNDSTVSLIIYKDGVAAYRGFGGLIQQTGDTGQVSTAHWIHVSTAPIVLASGTFFEVELTSTDNSITVKAHSNFAVHVLDTFSTQMVLATKSGDSAGANYSTATAIPWDGTDVYDTDAAHNPASSNTKIIVPSSMNGKHVICYAQVVMTNVADGNDVSLAIRKGGSYTYDGFAGNGGNQGTTNTLGLIDVRTPPLVVATADEFEAVLYSQDASVTLHSTSTFGLRVVDF